MANCKKGSVVTALNETVKRSHLASMRSASGLVASLVVKNDLTGNWMNADASKAYCGLVPTVGGVERYDLAFTQYDLLVENIPSFPSGDDVVFLTPQDALHVAARSCWREGITRQEWLNTILAKFPAGVKLLAVDYPARNKNGGSYAACYLGAEGV